MPVSILMVVVFPAPLWPSKAKISPRATSRSNPSNATTTSPLAVSKLFRTARSEIASWPTAGVFKLAQLKNAAVLQLQMDFD